LKADELISNQTVVVCCCTVSDYLPHDAVAMVENRQIDVHS